LIQLIFNGTYLPQTSNDKYYCHEETLGEDLTMISGRIVTEVRGLVWVAHYEYDRLPDDAWRVICGALRSKQSVPCTLLPDNADGMITATMKCTELASPTFAFARDGKGIWHNIAFTLREVKPHD